MDKVDRGIHILIVEDDEMQLELIKDAFLSGQTHYTIQMASSLKEVYAILAQTTPDIILTDNKLPDGEGKELIKATKEQIPLVLMTAHGSEEFAAYAIKEGAQDYIVKSPELFRRVPEKVKHVLLQWQLKIEKQQSEKALLESEKKFRDLFNNINDAVFLHEIGSDKMHKPFLEVNDVACRILEYAKEEFLSLTPFDIGSGEHADKAGNVVEKILSEGSACFEMVLVSKSGNKIPVEINAHRFQYNNKPAVLSVARDITEQKQYQQYIEHLNSILLAIRNVNQLIVQETDIYRMVQKAAGMLVETLAYSGCVIALMNEEIKKIVPVTHLGNTVLTKYFAISSDGKGKAPECVKKAICKQKIQVIRDINLCTDCSYSGCNPENGAVSVVIPMLRNNNVIGLVIVTREHKTFITNKEEQLLLEVADDLAFAREKIMAEESHRESENKYRTLFLAEPDPIFLVDENSGMLLDANPAAENLYGYTLDELLTMKAWELSCEQDETRKTIKIKNDTIVQIPERIHKKKNGERMIVEISARHFERNGRMINISSIRDITERKRAEEELILTQHTINNADLSIFWISPQGKFLYVNDGACRNLGYTKDELLNMHVWDVDPDNPPKTRTKHWKQYQKEKVKTFESWHKPKHGKPYPVEITSCYMEFKGQEYEFAYASNIRERKEAENDLKESEEKFRNFFDNTNEAIIIARFDGQFIQVNNALQKMLGYSEKELYEMNVMDVVAPEYAMKLQERLSTIIEKHETPVTEIEVVRKNKTLINIEISSKVINYLQDDKAILTVARDVTLRKQFEQKVLDSMIEAEDRERKRIAEDLHDEMGPYLSTIKLYVNEIKKVEDPEQKDKIFNNLNKILDQSVMKIKSISNNLMPNVLTDYGLVKAVESFVSNVIINPNIKINIETIGLNGRYHNKFEINLYRIVIELINNTLKHAKANEINIIFEENNNRFYLTYKDNGKGFDFDKKLLSKKGLGLQNILNRMHSMNGSHSVISGEGKGMIFSMEFNDVNSYYVL